MGYTVEQLKEAARKAVAAGDFEAAKRLVDNAKLVEGLAPTAQDGAPLDNTKAARNELSQAYQKSIDPSQQPADYGGQLHAGIAGAAQGATFGFADEVTARMLSMHPQIDYEEALPFVRGDMAKAQDQFPKTYIAGNVAGAVAVPVAGIDAIAARGGTKLAKLGYGMLAGGSGGAIAGIGASEGGVAEMAKGAAIGAGLGAVGGAVAVPIGNALSWAAQKGGKVLQRLVADKRMFAGNDFTDEGKATLQALGYNIDELTASFKQTFQKGINDALEPQQAARAADMAEFGIPAMRANVTGLADDFATMERGRRGALGPNVEAQVGSAMNAQDAAMRDAGEGLATRMGGGRTLDQGDAASMVMTAARNARDSAKKTAQSAYEELANMGAGVPGKALQTIGANMRRALEVSGTYIDDAATPNATATFKALDRTFAKSPKGAVPFMDLERARQEIVRNRASAYRGSLGPDQIAMDKALGAFDQKLDDLMSNTLTEGDPAVLEAAKRARGLWANYRQKFTGTGAASRFIQDMIDEDASPDQVVKWLFSSGKLGTGKFSSTIAKGVKETIGEDSDAWNAIRQSAVRQIIQKPNGMTQMGPQAISERLGDFLTSPSTREISRELFSKSEIAALQRYQGALKRMIAPAGAINHSGTAYEGARMARSAWQSLAATLGMAGGGLPGAAVAVAGGSAMQAGKGWLAAKSIMSPTVPITTSAGRLPTAAGRLSGGQGVTTLQSQGQQR